MTDKLVVLNVYGSGRSGTTLIGTLLNQVEGVFYAGELQPLWGPSWLPDELCSCGKPALECPVWSRVLHQVIQNRDLAEFIAEMRDLRDTTSRTRHLLLAPLLQKNPAWHARQRRFVEQTERLYRAIQHTTGCRIIVDTSKWPSYTALMSRYGNLTWRVIHVVRDPRAVVWSWRRKKAWPTTRGAFIRRQSTRLTVFSWLKQNFLAEFFSTNKDEYLLLKYEDFVHDPVNAANLILGFAGVKGNDAKWEMPLLLKEHHSLGANPSRIGQHQVSVAADDEWKTSMSTAEQMFIWMVTSPLALRYGYLPL